MPIPKPKPNQSEQDYVSAHMGNAALRAEYKAPGQLAAVLHNTYRESKKKGDVADPAVRFDEDRKDSVDRVVRFDVFKEDKCQITSHGFLVTDAFATRVGVFEYKDSEGNVTKEFRSPEEVFDQASLDSLSMVPVTRSHPPELVTVDNVKEYQIGMTGENVRKEGDFAACKVIITDKDEVKAIQEKHVAGRGDEVSLGYNCRVVAEDGEWKGERYDSAQKGIRYNHLGLVGLGRAGRDVKLKMDEEDEKKKNKKKEDMKMAKFKRDAIHVGDVHLDAKDVEIPDEASQLVDELSGKLDELIGVVDYLGKMGDAIQARHDAGAEELEKAKTDLADLTDPKSDKIQTMLKARGDLEAVADKLKVEHKDKDDKDVKVDIIKSVSKDFDPEGKSDEYVDARYDAIAEGIVKTDKEDKKEELRSVIRKADKDAGEPVDRRDEYLEKVKDVFVDGEGEKAPATTPAQ